MLPSDDAEPLDGDATGFVLPAFVEDPKQALADSFDETGYVEPAFARGRADAGDWLRPQPDGLVTWLFDPGSFAPVAKLIGLVALAVITDHLGTPFSLLREDGTAAWTAEIAIDGNVAEQIGEEICPFRFAGQYADGETGLSYNGFRYYDPDVGGYISRDPLGLAGGPRLYGYVIDPLVGIDPFGLRDPESCVEAFGNRAYFNPNIPYSYMVPNHRGAEVWVNFGAVDTDQVAHMVLRPDANMPVTVLMGNHGSLDGKVYVERDNFHIMAWGLSEIHRVTSDPWLSNQGRNVQVVDTMDMIVRNDWRTFQNLIGQSEGRVICGWCYSDRSQVVMDALRGAW